MLIGKLFDYIYIYKEIRGIPYGRNYLSSHSVIDCTGCIIQREMASEFKNVYYNYYIMYVDYYFESINNDTPTTLIIIMIITMIGLLVKHNHLFSLQKV